MKQERKHFAIEKKTLSVANRIENSRQYLSFFFLGYQLTKQKLCNKSKNFKIAYMITIWHNIT